jgi:hypothetical protein
VERHAAEVGAFRSLRVLVRFRKVAFS